MVEVSHSLSALERMHAGVPPIAFQLETHWLSDSVRPGILYLRGPHGADGGAWNQPFVSPSRNQAT